MRHMISNRRDDLAASFGAAAAAMPPRVRAEAAERAAYSTESTAIPMNESTPGGARRTGWILSGIVIAFMVADAGADLLAIEPMKNAMLETGYPLDQIWLIGALALICIVLYAIPATSVLGGHHPYGISGRRDHEPPSSGGDADSRDDLGRHSWSVSVGPPLVSRSAASRLDPAPP
jgi:hypothetical protein